MDHITELALELDRLKSVYRKSYLTDGERLENSAEHSWHLAVMMMAMAPYLPAQLDIDHCIKMALCHDIGEIGPGDVCVYEDQTAKQAGEAEYLAALSRRFSGFGQQATSLWQEYEQGESLEAQWLAVFDRLLPFLLNLANEGRTWQEQGIRPDMVRAKHAFIADMMPALHQWMMQALAKAETDGWFTAV